MSLYLYPKNSIERIGDHSYFVKDKKVIASIPEQMGTPEVRSFLLDRCHKQLPTGQSSSKPIRVGSRSFCWVLSKPEEEQPFFSKISSAVNNFFFPPSEKGYSRYRLEEVKTSGRFSAGNDPGKMTLETELLKFETLLSQGLSLEEIQHGVRGNIPLSNEKERLTTPRFSDPYTQLASLAFQGYEPDYTNKDIRIKYPTSCAMCLVEDQGSLKLQYQTQASKTLHSNTVQNYYDYLVNEFGTEKITYIEHLYGISFDDMISKNEPLSPEVVYRVNIGFTNLEVQDVQSFYSKLQDLLRNVKDLDPKVSLESLFLSNTAGSEIDIPLNGNERKCLLEFLKHHHIHKNIKGLLDWAHKNDFDQNLTFTSLSDKQSGELISILKIKSDERSKALTGRAIFENILGWYNSGELLEYKPWLDQQQLIQALEKSEDSTSQEAFYEMLAFVAVKMHLVREHPTEGYRVGALIPAPPDKSGIQKWYRVTSCLSNGQGKFNYMLEGVGKNSNLPPIQLNRSTAGSPYCMHGQSSMKNDMNPLNSPGYLGHHLGDAYEKPFFLARSIPVWVGYLVKANKEIKDLEDKPHHHTPVTPTKSQLESLFDLLTHSTTTLQKDQIRPFKQKNMHQLLRQHDAILIDMLSTEGRLLSSPFSKKGELKTFTNVLDGLKAKYINSKKNTRKPSEEKQDAKDLIVILRNYASSELKPHQRGSLVSLISDLEEHILKDGVSLQIQQKKLLAKDNFVDVLSLMKDECHSCLKEGKLSEAYSLLKTWSNKLEIRAKILNEHPSQKIQQGTLFVGHSLGGAEAQLNAYSNFFEEGRIPCPNQSMTVYAFDSPGINADDNFDFKQFGSTHSKLLKDLGIKISIHHSQESGDPIAFGGEEHLGATFDNKEASQVEGWLEFVGEVFERKKEAETPSIAQSKTAHGTQFRLGKETQDYTRTFYNSFYQGIIDKGVATTSKGMQEVAQSLKKKTWRMDFFSSPTTEKLRSSTINTILFFLLTEKEEKPRGESFFDSRGVFAVNESGVISKQKRE